VRFGEPVENQPREQLPLLDEIELATDQDLEDPPPVAVFAVTDPAPIVRALPTEHPIVVAGDGDGLVAATSAGVVDPDRAVLYSAGLLDREDPAMFDTVLDDGADIVITDSNRRRARRWGAIRENEGATERGRPGTPPLRRQRRPPRRLPGRGRRQPHRDRATGRRRGRRHRLRQPGQLHPPATGPSSPWTATSAPPGRWAPSAR
jgi:hypothetical protein